MGVDARAVVTGLASVKATALGWATSLREELRGKIGAFLAAGTVLEGFNKVKEEILEISRLSEELGASTNFIQSLQLKAQQMGVGIESLTRPFVVFNRQIGEAKRGIPEAVEKLSDMGIITDKNQLATLNYTDAMRNLKIQFDKIGDSAKQDALLNEAFGNSAYRVAFIFRQSMGDFDKMTQGNFFTKFSRDSITDFQNLWSILKAGFYAIGVTITNTADIGVSAFRRMSIKLGFLFKTGHVPSQAEINRLDDKYQEQLASRQNANDADAQDIEVQQKKAEILTQQTALLERQTELTNEIADRGKVTIADMAEQARRLLGLPQPRLYSVSSRMRDALRIDNLERQSTLAFEKGDDATFQKLRSEADQLRQNSPWAKLQDRNPMQRTESELVRVNQQLGPVQEMAKLVLTEHKTPQ